MEMLPKQSKEWWEELLRLSELLKQWSTDRNNQELQKQVRDSMEKLGFIIPIEE